MPIHRQHVFVALTLLGVFVALAVGNYTVFTRPHPALNDFMSRWEGARSYWRDGLNPYGDEASLNIQMRIYGRAVREGEDPGYFAYPFYTVFALWLLVYLEYAWASALWMAVLQVCLLGALILLLSLFRWRVRPVVLGGLAVWMLISYYPARGLLLGQPGHVVYFLQVLALWSLAREWDRLAGVALAVSTIKPQMGYLFVPFLLLWGLYARRWAFVRAFALVFGLLMAASFLLLPSWLGDWLAQVARYPDYTEIGSPVWVLTRYYLGDLAPVPGKAAEVALTAACYGLVLWGWFTVLVQHRPERLMWAIMLTLTVTHLVAPRTATPHFVVFTIPLIFYLWQLSTGVRRGDRWVALVLLVLFATQWAHFLLTVEGEFEHPTVYLPLPFGMLALLWATRRLWWAQPPMIRIGAARPLKHHFERVYTLFL